MMWASEVLPRPGGPASRTWSSGSPRRRAASMKMPSCSVTWTWLTKSASFGGRSDRSKSSSPPTGRASWMTISSSPSTPGVRIPLPGSTINASPPQLRFRGLRESRLRPRRTPQRGLDDLLGALAAGLGEQPLSLGGRIAEVEQSLPGQRAGILPFSGRRGGVGVALDLPRDLLAQLDDDPLRRALPDAGNGLEALRVPGGDRP